MSRKFDDCSGCAHYRKRNGECDDCDYGENYTDKEAEAGLNFEDDSYGCYEED